MKQIVRVMGDKEFVIAHAIPTLDAAEKIQRVYIDTDKTGADFYITDAE